MLCSQISNSMAFASQICLSRLPIKTTVKPLCPLPHQLPSISTHLNLLPSCRQRLRSTITAATTAAVEFRRQTSADTPSKHLPFRVGHGFDLHRLEPGYPLIIGGISIPHERGCEAHSDGNWLPFIFFFFFLRLCGYNLVCAIRIRTNLRLCGYCSLQVMCCFTVLLMQFWVLWGFRTLDRSFQIQILSGREQHHLSSLKKLLV